MGQRDLAGAEGGAAARHAGGGNGVVRGAEGPPGDHGVLPAGEAHDGIDLRGGQGLLPRQVGQDGGQTLGHHGLARAGTARHQNVVAARGGDLQRPLGLLLSLDLAEVGAGTDGGGGYPRLRRGDESLPPQVGGQLPEMADGIDGQSPGQRGLRCVVGREVEGGDARPLCRQRHGQHAADGAQLTGQGQLTQEGGVLLSGEGQLPACGQNAHQNGQVVDGAHLFPVGGGQVDGDAGHGKIEAAGLDGGAHPFPGFLDGGIGQTHHVKGGQTAGQGALGADRIAGNSLQTQGQYVADQKADLPFADFSDISIACRRVFCK